MKNQNAVDNIAALTLSAYTKKLEKEKELKDERTWKKLVYGRIGSMAYARSNLHEVSAVNAVHYLLQGTTFGISHDFQPLHLACHLSDVNEDASFLNILRAEGSYVPIQITQNYTVRPIELEDKISLRFYRKILYNQ